MDPYHLKDWVTIHRSVNNVSDNPLRTGLDDGPGYCTSAGSRSTFTGPSPTSARHMHAEWEGQGPAHSVARIRYELSGDGRRSHRLCLHQRVRAPGRTTRERRQPIHRGRHLGARGEQFTGSTQGIARAPQIDDIDYMYRVRHSSLSIHRGRVNLAGFVDTTVKEIDDRLRELKEEVAGWRRHVPRSPAAGVDRVARALRRARARSQPGRAAPTPAGPAARPQPEWHASQPGPRARAQHPGHHHSRRSRRRWVSNRTTCTA